MRTLLLVALFVGGSVSSARAQEQERKLLERVLKPDMSLQNDMQSREFTPPSGTLETKQAHTKWFFIRKRSREKEFAGVRSFDAKTFATQQSRFADSRADLSTRSDLQKLNSAYPAPGYTGVRSLPESGRTVATSNFVNSTRPFLVRGKRQAVLDQQNKQLTIDQVRELLNKNK